MAARPSSRRMSVAKSPSVRKPAIRPEKQATEDIDSDLPEPARPVTFGDSSADESSSGTSSRRMRAGGSSRRAAAQSGTSARRTTPLTEEELEARAQARKQGMLLAIALLAVVAIGTVGFLFLMRGDPAKDLAVQGLGLARAELIAASGHLDGSRPVAAKESIEIARKTLDGVSNTVGGAQKVELVNRLADLENRSITIERDVKVADNRQELLSRFGKLTTIDELALTNLVKDAESFVRNPVDPTSAVSADGIVQEAYKQAISEVQSQIQRADSELVRRTKASTINIVSTTRITVEGLCQQERFAEAEEVIATAAAAHPQADLAAVRTDLNEAAEKAWNSTKTYAETRLIDAQSKGLPVAQRTEARAAGKARLQKVIDVWGVETYVSQAKALLATFE